MGAAKRGEVEHLRKGRGNSTEPHEPLASRSDIDWIGRALSNFANLLDAMTSVKQGRRLRARLEQVVVGEDRRTIDIHFVDLSVGLPQPTVTEEA